MTLSSLTFNDWLQWLSVGVILLIVAVTVIRKVVRFNRMMRNSKDGGTSGCGCGCSGCGTPCELKDSNSGKRASHHSHHRN